MQYSTILALAVAAFSIPITLAEEKYVIAHVIVREDPFPKLWLSG